MDGITTRREEVLNTARRLVMGDRNRTYGPPTEDFARTARILTAMGLRMVGADGEVRDLAAHDHALILLAVKLSRLCNDPQHLDSWVDVAGYAACGWECVPSTAPRSTQDWETKVTAATGATAKISKIEEELRLAVKAEASNNVRCPSCDHKAKWHKTGGCWFTVETGSPDADSVCGCSVSVPWLQLAVERKGVVTAAAILDSLSSIKNKEFSVPLEDDPE